MNLQTVTQRLDLCLEKDSIFYKLGSYGLISFSDYIFLLTVLSSEYLNWNMYAFWSVYSDFFFIYMKRNTVYNIQEI